MKRPVILHPFLFALLPILLLYRQNISELKLRDLPGPLIITFIAALILWLILLPVLRSGKRAALLSAVFWMWFFACGHLYYLLYEKQAQDAMPLLTPQLFLNLYCLAFLGGVFFAVRQKRGLDTLTSLLNFIAMALVLLNLASIGRYEYKRRADYSALQKKAAIQAVAPAVLPGASASTQPAGVVPQAQSYPNIYHIVLDGYARADILKELYDYDNGDMLRFLHQKGFHVSGKSRVNYCQTALTLASMFNYEYLDELTERIKDPPDNRVVLAQMINNSRLFETLKGRGYRLVNFDSGYGTSALKEAVHFSPKESSPIGSMVKSGGLSEFQEAIINLTPLYMIFDSLALGNKRNVKGSIKVTAIRTRRVERTNYAFEHLADAQNLKPPLFVFAHILCPHAPFIFDRNGLKKSEDIRSNAIAEGIDLQYLGSEEEYLQDYREQVMYVNKKLKQTLESLLARTKGKAVIIIHSDHGPASHLDWERAAKTYMKERFSNLFAYYLPDGERLPIGDKVTMVNVYRHVLNHYFAAKLKPLPDNCYYSSWGYPYQFIDVTDLSTKTFPPSELRRFESFPIHRRFGQ